MRILMVTRGSQGDVYPYLAVATALSQNHEVTISLPQAFRHIIKGFDLNYVLQAEDDIPGMLQTEKNIRELLEWTGRVIHDQFEELIPLLSRNDILISSNTEFAAPSIAEYCGKPCIRTAYAPLLPGKKIPPPVVPPSPFPPAFQWRGLNIGLNLMVKKNLNSHRKELGMYPIADQGEHAPSNADNFMMYSRYLGEVDPDWKYSWDIGGYCFNDILNYDEIAYRKLLDFIEKDERPTLFFTLGSCSSKKGNDLCVWLCNICQRLNYKLIIGSGWSKLGTFLQDKKYVFLLTSAVPHYLIFPVCTAIIHHGGSGTTHSAGRSGKPQMVVPLLLDQFYWGSRVFKLGAGPDYVRVSSISRKKLEEKVVDLMTNPSYKKGAYELGEKIRGEDGLQAICDYINRRTSIRKANF